MFLTAVVTIFSASTIFGLLACLGASRTSRLEENFYSMCPSVKDASINE